MNRSGLRVKNIEIIMLNEDHFFYIDSIRSSFQTIVPVPRFSIVYSFEPFARFSYSRTLDSRKDEDHGGGGNGGGGEGRRRTKEKGRWRFVS